MIAIVDYGVGNINAFVNIYKNLNMDYKIARNRDDLVNITKLILPGVGSFDYAMIKLNESGMREKLDELVTVKKIPVLGICVGLQILAKSSEEGIESGLGWINGHIKKLDRIKLKKNMPLPHMGWNNIDIKLKNHLVKNLDNNSRFYFLHSYFIECDNKDIIATTEYGEDFASIINHDNIYGIQPHPEKSHSNGIIVLKNFGEL